MKIRTTQEYSGVYFRVKKLNINHLKLKKNENKVRKIEN